MEIISRREAIEQGLVRYFTGKPCKNGHINQRNTKSGLCMECSRLNARNYYEEHPNASKDYYYNNKEQILLKNKQWQQNNKQKVCSNAKKWQYKNKDNVSKVGKKWNRANKHKRLLYGRFRKDKIKQHIPSWYEEEQIKMLYLKRDELNKQWGTNFQVDHIIPLNPKNKSVCGLHCWSNLQLLDASLNQSKNDTYETDW